MPSLFSHSINTFCPEVKTEYTFSDHDLLVNVETNEVFRSHKRIKHKELIGKIIGKESRVLIVEQISNNKYINGQEMRIQLPDDDLINMVKI